MVWKKIETNTWKPDKEDEEIVGVLIGVEDSDLYEGNKIYHLIEDSGDKVVIYGTTQLNRLMTNIPPESRVKIIYKGEEPSKKGKPTKIFEVYRDE